MGIRRMFFLNEIVPGQKISYRDLAEKLKMSPTPIIQALKRLEFQGLVRHEPNRGYYTEAIRIKEVEEIYELRELIELSLLPKSIALMDESGLSRVKEAMDAHALAFAGNSINERLMADMEFHLVLAELSGCRVQKEALRNLFDLLYLKYRGSMLFVTSMDEAAEEHKRVFHSLAEKDLAGARKHLSHHILNVKKHALISLDRMLSEKENY